MAAGDQTLLYGLLFTNAALYALLIAGILRKATRKPEVSNLAEAFLLLESALKDKFPELPIGFTWGEAMSRIKVTNPEVNWSSVEVLLDGYEAYRYGGLELSVSDPREVLRLAFALGKGAKFVRGP